LQRSVTGFLARGLASRRRKALKRRAAHENLFFWYDVDLCGRRRRRGKEYQEPNVGIMRENLKARKMVNWKFFGVVMDVRNFIP